MKAIVLKPVVHRGARRLLAIFDYDAELIQLMKQVSGSAWSQTHRSWHVPDNKKSIEEIISVFRGKALVDMKDVEERGKLKGESEERGKGQVKSDALAVNVSNDIEYEVQKFRDWMRQKRYSESSIDSYSEAILIFFGFFKDKTPEQIVNNDIVQFNTGYIIKNGLSYSYQNQFVNAIKLFYRKNYSKNIEIDCIERPRRARRLPKVISKNDVMRMLKSITNQKHRMALTMIYACGLRRSELINMKLKHLDSKRKNVTIFNGKGKKDRVLPLSDKLLEQIKKYYFTYRPEVYLIEGQYKGQPYSEASLEKIFHKYLGAIIKNHNFTRRLFFPRPRRLYLALNF